MRISPLLALLLFSLCLNAEGTRELAPNANIVVTGSNTNDVAALLIDNSEYNSFASYTNPDTNSRLYIHISDPQNECIYLGLAFGHINQTSQNPARLAYEYRVRDPNGNVVFGPVTVPTTGGNIANWSQAHTGPSQIYGAGGYNATEVMSSALTSQGWSGEGDYFIEFDYAGSGGGLLIDYWDITVVNCSGSTPEEKKGRVWSYNWAIFAINDFGFPNRPFDGAFYVCAPDPDNPDAAFITKIDFNNAGFRPAAFNVAFNSFGSMNTGNVMSDRRSVENANSTQAEYPVFLNDPVDLCTTAEPGDIQLLGVTRCDMEDYCIKYIASKEGQIDLLLDFDGPDDVYTPGSADVMVAIDVPADEVGKPACIYWDGKDGLGNPLDENVATTIPVVISYAQGIYHFPIYDAEYMINGFMIQAVRPAGPQPLLYYDDSQISVASGSGEPTVQLTGCMPPCHRWTVFNDPNVPGFGNLNTINSWWFSQRVLRSEVFFLPAYLSCGVNGPEGLCEGETAMLAWDGIVQPGGGEAPEVVSITWSGPDVIGTNQGTEVMIGSAGTYDANVLWLTPLGDTCSSACEINVDAKPVTAGFIDTLIVSGDTIDINGELYSEGGQYVQTLTGTNGCDSVLTIRVSLLQTAVHFSLDDCNSFPSQGTDSIYTEFVPEYPEPVSCATVDATIVYRENPGVNRHSCTPGVDGNPGMCVSSLDSCTFVNGDEKAVVFEVTVTPAMDTAAVITGLSFFERGPEMYDWISGPTGPNNYPTLYGVRILKDGVEIYRQVDIPSTTNWSLETFDFRNLDDFVVDTTSVFRFELMGYCLVGNGADVAAWDLDEISVQASCALTPNMFSNISGRIFTESGKRIKDVEIQLSEDPAFSNPLVTISNDQGEFVFPDNPAGEPYYLHASKNTDFMEGVSTLDLVRIQKHLLGIRPFDSPLQYLAADANNSASVSVLDLVDIRKLILGYYTELPHNTSWRFGKAGQSLSLSDPWNFEETINIQSLGEDLENVNFLAVKIGDVNGSISNINGDITSRSVRTVQLKYDDRNVQAGENVVVDITASDFYRVAGWQAALTVDGGTILGVRNGALDMTDAVAVSPDGHAVRIAWVDAHLRDVGQDEVLFSLVIEASHRGQLSSMLALDPLALRCEAYAGASPEIIGLELRKSESEEQTVSGNWMQCTPNPFSHEVSIHFYCDQAGPVELRILNVSGAEVYHKSGYFAAGSHVIRVAGDDLGIDAGILFCQLECAGFARTVTLMKTD